MRLIRHLPLTVSLGLAALSAAAAETPAGIPPLKIFTARETGAVTMAWSAAQDAEGTMYFGCDTVISFNGDRWHTEAMTATYLVRGLDTGPDGRIWAGGVNQFGWFERNDAGNLTYHSLMPTLSQPNLEPGEIWKAYADGPGRAFFIARDKVFYWDGSATRSWNFPGQNILWAHRTPRAIYLDYPPQGLLRLDHNGPSLVAPATVMGSSEMRWIDDSGPSWLLLTLAGFEQLRDGHLEPVNTPASDFARANAPTSAVRLANGILAVGTLRGGIALVDEAGNVIQVLDHSCGLPGDQIYSLFVDRDGALWGVGPAYIFRLGLQSGASLYPETAGYPAGGADSLACQDGAIYIASQNGLRRLEPGSRRGSGRFVGLPFHSDRPYSVLSTPSGLVIGTLDGFAKWSDRGLVPEKDIPEAVFRTQISSAKPGRVLASLRDKVLLVDPQIQKSEVVADGLPDYGDSLADDSAGRTWIGTPSRGLYLAQSGDVHAKPVGPAFGPMPQTGAAYVAASGASILALTEAGAFVLGPSAERFQAVLDFPKGKPAAISNVGRNGEIWAAVEVGRGTPRIGRIRPKGTNWAWTSASVEGLSDVGSVLTLYLDNTSDGDELWIGGTQSLLRAPTHALFPHLPPQPKIRVWLADPREAIPVKPSDRVPYARRGVYSEFSSLDFGRREPDQFEMMLEGAETEWEAADSSTHRALLGLREGRYTLRVRSVSEFGEQSPDARFGFSIAPPWWRSNLAYVSAAVAGVLAAALLYRLRTHALRKRALELEQMVRDRTAELERANAAKTEFVASMSHEIRNPMGGILSTALQLAETPLSEPQVGLVATLSSCAQFLSKLVEDVLDFAVIESGAYQVATAPLRPRDLLESVVVMLRAAAVGRQVSIHVDDALPDVILGDSGRIQQILVNFTTNALKFGGPTVHLSARAEEDWCLFAVADDGPGISASEQDFLFARFSRLKAARNSAVPGTGLGLAVSRELAHRMGGSVGVASQEGKGALFFLKIPLKVEVQEADDLSSTTRRRALVIEDIAYNARALDLMLNRLGYAVDIASTGSQALAKLRLTKFEAILVDCDVPELSGIEIVRRFRANEGSPRTLIIATTALATPENMRACREAGMDCFVAKPVTPEKLRGALAREATEEYAPPKESAFDFALLAHLTDGSARSLKLEVARYGRALADALAEVETSMSRADRPSIRSATHRVLSLARLINAVELIAASRDLQDYASVHTDHELSAECAAVTRRGAELLEALEMTINSPGA